MQNNNSKLNTVLLIVLVVLAAACLVVLLTQRTERRMPAGENFPNVNYSNSNIPNEVTYGSSQSQEVAINNQTVSQSSKKVFTAGGMSVSMPVGQGYSFNTSAPGALANVGQVLNIVKNNMLVATLTKFSSQSFLRDSTPGSSSDWTLVNANYNVSGVAAQYYERATGSKSGETLVVVPSKLVTIYITADDSLTAEILASVKIN